MYEDIAGIISRWPLTSASPNSAQAWPVAFDRREMGVGRKIGGHGSEADIQLPRNLIHRLGVWNRGRGKPTKGMVPFLAPMTLWVAPYQHRCVVSRPSAASFLREVCH